MVLSTIVCVFILDIAASLCYTISVVRKSRRMRCMAPRKTGNPYVYRETERDFPCVCHDARRKGTIVTTEKSVEQLTLDDTDKRNAEKLRKSFLKVLSKDKRSEEIHLEFHYNAFMRCAEYLVIGHPRTIKKCLSVMKKFVRALDKQAKQKEKKEQKAWEMPKGTYYEPRKGKK